MSIQKTWKVKRQCVLICKVDCLVILEHSVNRLVSVFNIVHKCQQILLCPWVYWLSHCLEGKSNAGDGYIVSKSKHKCLVAWSINVVCIDLLLLFSKIGNLCNKITICKINRLV